jgi:hypothetical protein
MTNPYVRFIDEPLLSLASKVTEVWYRTLKTAPPRQRWIALIAFFVPIFLYNCAVVPRSTRDTVMPGAGVVLSLLALLVSIAMIVVGSARLKLTSNEWDARRYKACLTEATRHVTSGRVVRIVFPLVGMSNLIGYATLINAGSTVPLVNAQFGLWFFALAAVSYMMACEPPKPDDGDGFAFSPAPTR